MDEINEIDVVRSVEDSRKPVFSKKVRLLAVMAVCATILIWGITFVNTKSLLKDFSSFEILFLRFFLGYLCLLAATGFKKFQLKAKKDDWFFLGMGITGMALYQFLENCAIQFTNASNVSILVTVCPMGTALAMWAFTKSKTLTRNFFFGFLIGIAGVVLVSLNGISELHFHPAGDLLAILAMVSWSFYSLIVTKVNEKNYDPLMVNRRAFFWALAVMVPFFFFCDFSLETNIARFSSALNWFNLLFLGVLASSLAFAAWSFSCHVLGTVRTTVGLYLIPVVTLVFAFFFLHESMSLMGMAGALLTVAGVALSEKNKK